MKSKEHREKISETLKSKGIKPRVRFDITGKKRSESWKVKMKETMKVKFPGITKTCPQCSKEFRVGLCHSWRKFCSRACHSLGVTKPLEWHRTRAVKDANLRRARKQNNGGEFTTQEWEDLKKEFNYMCLCCKKHEPEVRLCIDHIVPLSRGGNNSIDNMQPLCRSCNARKRVDCTDYRLNIPITTKIQDLL